MDATLFIDKAKKAKRQPIFVLCGDEEFLKRRALAVIESIVIGDSDPSFSVSSYPGDKADFSAVRNELVTLPFLSDARLVIIEQADSFVTKFRAQLEKYVAEPSTQGVLALDVKTWTATTKLAKAVPDEGTLVCKGPKPYLLPGWCVKWAQTHYQKKLPTQAAEMLVELIGDQMSLLDSELNKLAIYAGEHPTITTRDVDQLVGRSRGANVFRILDAVGDGKAGEALSILGALFEEGQSAVATLGALGSQLRKLAMTARLRKQGIPLDDAMDRAAIMTWPAVRTSARNQLKHIGWSRLDRLYDWLIEADLGVKGESALSERAVLERLIVRLAKPAAGKPTSG